MKAQYKKNTSLIVEVLNYSDKFFTGQVIESGTAAWNNGEVSTKFRIADYNILNDMQEMLIIRDQLKTIVKNNF